MPSKDIKQKTTKRRSTVKSTENKRKVPRKSSTQLKKGGVIGRIYDPNKNQYEANRYHHYDPKFVFDQNQNRYDLDNIDYSVPYGFQYTRPKIEIDKSKIDVQYDHDMKHLPSDDIKKGNVSQLITDYPKQWQSVAKDENEYPGKRLESWGRQNAMRYDDDYKILEKKEVPKKEIKGNIFDRVSFFNKLQNTGGRKVTKKQVVPKKKVTKKQVVPKKKVTKKPADPKKKVTKKPTDPKKKVTKK